MLDQVVDDRKITDFKKLIYQKLIKNLIASNEKTVCVLY